MVDDCDYDCGCDCDCDCETRKKKKNIFLGQKVVAMGVEMWWRTVAYWWWQ
jgi:hypothetical protein